MQNRDKVKRLLDYCLEQKENLPEFSKLGTNNHAELDEQISVFYHYLNSGTIPDMTEYFSDLSYIACLWLYEKHTLFDDVLEEIDGRD